ncbi:MAG TPA: hypothetical protein VK974_04830 [Methylophilaceae bacterium]|nr:hypothetical protein [Methylophilaceae bacterium]
MSSTVKLAKGGTHFSLTCNHCQHERKEVVNPDLNPLPYAFNPNCTACSESLEPDFLLISEVQASFIRAMRKQKNAAQSLEAMDGTRRGDRAATDSPLYLAYSRASAGITKAAQIHQGVIHTALPAHE